MADLLIVARSASHADPEKDRRGCWKKGDIVEVRDSGAPRGAKEGSPLFVWVECPGVTRAQVEDRMQPWRWRLEWSVVNRSLPQDGWRVSVANADAAVSGAGNLTRARIEPWLNRWGAAVQSAAAGAVTFDWSIYAGLQSAGWWDVADLTGVTFSEELYDTTTGLHRVRADYTGHARYQARPDRFARSVVAHLDARGVSIVSHDGGVVVYESQRVAVRDAFADTLRGALGTYRRRRYHISEADVDQILSAGGAVQVTAAQLANRVLDRRAE